MARILFTWEMGGGIGHVAPHIDVIRHLEALGHDVFFALKNLNQAADLFRDTRVTWLQAPRLETQAPARAKAVSYVRILANRGYDNTSALGGCVRAWLNLYDLIKPDLIVFDYSPAAMLAARSPTIACPTLKVGAGFFLPPETQPLPAFGDTSLDEATLMEEEERLLHAINAALEQSGIAPLERFADMLRTDRSLLTTLPELDHYRNRQGGDYVGVFRSPAGARPQWPTSGGPRVFVYAHRFEPFSRLFELLRSGGYSTLVYAGSLTASLQQQYRCDSISFSDELLDLTEIGRTADAAICNANYSTAAELLLSGVPLLLAPLHGEQSVGARNIAALGAGLSTKPRASPETMKLLGRLINEPSFRRSAAAFAEKYRDMDHDSALRRTLANIRELLG